MGFFLTPSSLPRVKPVYRLTRERLGKWVDDTTRWTGPALTTVLLCTTEVAGMLYDHGRELVGTPGACTPYAIRRGKERPVPANFPMGLAVATRLGNVDAAFRL